MFRYVLRRLALFLPTLFVISLIGFILAVNAPGDPCDRIIGQADASLESYSGTRARKNECEQKLGLHLPVFYLSLTSLATPDTLHRVIIKSEREMLQRLIAQHGNWEAIQRYRESIISLENRLLELGKKSSNNEKLHEAALLSYQLRSAFKEDIILQLVREISDLSNNLVDTELGKVQLRLGEMKTESTIWKNYLPTINFHADNQYHRWMFGGAYSKGIVRGDFGISYQSRRPVTEKLKGRLFWSVLLTLISVLLAYGIAIPLGVNSAARKGSRFDKISGAIVFMLYALPVFWVALLLLLMFANPDVLQWLPASGIKPAIGYPEGAGILQKAWITLPYLILPVICYTYGSIAFLARTSRASMLEVLGMDFIRTARAKGIPEKQITWKHGWRNALLPIITVFVNVFPAAVGASVILETIFTIPGMGREIFVAVFNNDYPVLIAVFMLIGFLTISGFLIADILYAWADPRIQFSKEKA